MLNVYTFHDKRPRGEEVDITDEGQITEQDDGLYIRLSEVPLRYINTIAYGETYLASGAYTQILKEQVGGGSEPIPGRFVVNYESGKVDFNAAQEDYYMSVTYKGRGSTIWAADMNKLMAGFIPRAFTRQEIIDLPEPDKQVHEWFFVTDYGRMGFWDGTDVVI